jgi:hypothetical protein
MSHEKSEPGRVAPVISGRHGPALRRRRDIHYLRFYKLITIYHLPPTIYLFFTCSSGGSRLKTIRYAR